jgi:hypothetical protein
MTRQTHKSIGLLSILLIACCSHVPAQTTVSTVDKTNLYYLAFSAYLEKRNQMYEKTAGLADTNYLNLFVEEDSRLNNGFPAAIGRNTVEYLGYRERIEHYKKLRTEFRLIVFQPITTEGNRLIVNFGEYLWSWKKKTSIYSLSDGCKVEIYYDCEAGKFIVSKVDLWGV